MFGWLRDLVAGLVAVLVLLMCDLGLAWIGMLRGLFEFVLCCFVVLCPPTKVRDFVVLFVFGGPLLVLLGPAGRLAPRLPAHRAVLAAPLEERGPDHGWCALCGAAALRVAVHGLVAGFSINFGSVFVALRVWATSAGSLLCSWAPGSVLGLAVA